MAEPVEEEIQAIGAPRTPLRDFYHAMMRLSWRTTLLVIVGTYLLANAIFAGIYVEVGGVSNGHDRSFLWAFFFSVQTMGTIGYGAMSPESVAANVVVVGESVVSLLLTAISTGLIFAKFSRPTARLVFSRQATVSKMDGKPTLAFRVGNARSNRIVEARVRLAMVRTETTAEGRIFYRMHDLHLARERILSLQRSWTVMHIIDAQSPLNGETRETLIEKEVELFVAISGTDDTWMQTVHASHRYQAEEIAFGSRHADVLLERDGRLVLDLRRFHDLEDA
jgi:inward rectifier potassium channel